MWYGHLPRTKRPEIRRKKTKKKKQKKNKQTKKKKKKKKQHTLIQRILLLWQFRFSSKTIIRLTLTTWCHGTLNAYCDLDRLMSSGFSDITRSRSKSDNGSRHGVKVTVWWWFSMKTEIQTVQVRDITRFSSQSDACSRWEPKLSK